MTFFATRQKTPIIPILLTQAVILAIGLAAAVDIFGGEVRKPPTKPSDSESANQDKKNPPTRNPLREADLTFREIQILSQKRDLGKGRLLKMISSKDAKIRRAAAMALGYIRNPRSLIELGFRIEKENDPEALQEMLFAIGQISATASEQLAAKHPDRVSAYREQIIRRACTPLRNLLSRKDDKIPGGVETRALAIEALGKTGIDNEADYIVPGLKHSSPLVKTHAIRALARTSPKPYFTEIARQIGHSDSDVSIIASWAVTAMLYEDRKLRKNSGQIIKNMLGSGNPWTRFYGYNAARGALLPELASVVVKAARKEKSPVLKIAAAKALAQFTANEDVPVILKNYLTDSNLNVQIEAIYAAGDLGDEFVLQEALGLLKKKETDLEVRAAILKVHARRNGSKALKLVEPYVTENDVNFRIRMAECLGLMGDDESLKLMKFLRTDEDPRVHAAVLRALAIHQIRVDEAYSMAKEALRVPNTAVKYEALLVLHNARKEWAIDLIAAQYSKCHEAKYSLIRLLVLKLVARDFMEKYIPLFRLALTDPNPEVRVAAKDFFKNRLNREEEINPPYSNLRTFLEIPPAGIRYEILTTQGAVIIETLPDAAPAHAAAFQMHVKRMFYDRMVFHRVRPGIMLETGDPLGVGLGGPDFFIPDEINRLKHVPGMVGFGDRGPDTGGSQIYFCLTPRPELDGRFTIFAKVIKGMDILLNIQFGDKIHSIRKITEKTEQEKIEPQKNGKTGENPSPRSKSAEK
ncbi:MAG: HEAT repeat domain-containing protein [Planctomycetota bacterium]|jgi:peptidyl-prolyl cis-trans isomerase B (cyclophilin B)